MIMGRRRTYKINLTDEELKTLRSVIRKKETSKTIRSRCQILIDLDEAHGKVLTREQCAKSNGVFLATVTNTVSKYVRTCIHNRRTPSGRVFSRHTVSISLEIRQDSCGKFPCLAAKSLVHPASASCEYRF